MKIAVCVGDDYGLLFNKRRVSRDKAVMDKVLSLCQGASLWAHPYSETLFPEGIPVCVDEDFLAKAQLGDVCFLETADICKYVSGVEELILFRWNRKYPYDLAFPFEEYFSHWSMIKQEDFPGNSHDVITMEVYRP